MSGGKSGTGDGGSGEGEYKVPEALYAEENKLEHPIRVVGAVVHGFGRGSASLGIPTANIDPESDLKAPLDSKNGIYYGWATFPSPPEGIEPIRYKMVMSAGWNPHFGDMEKRSLEPHLVHDFGSKTFYDTKLELEVVGYLRDEAKFDSLEDLIATIREDIRRACAHLESSE